MPIQNNLKLITLTAGGGTENLPVLAIDNLYVVKGTATLSSSWTIQASGTPGSGMEYRFKYEADITLGVNTITFFGTTMPETLVDKTCEITAYYDGTDWEVNFIVDVDETGIIPLAVIEQNPFREIPTSTEVMFDGRDSPVVTNSVQTEGTTNSELYYKVDELGEFIEIYGTVSTFDIDETAVAGDLSVQIMTDSAHILSTIGGLNLIIPVSMGYLSTIGDVDPIGMKGCYITKASTFTAVYLVVPAADLGTGTDAQYKGYVSFKVPYTA
jgi:hypothetical protein